MRMIAFSLFDAGVVVYNLQDIPLGFATTGTWSSAAQWCIVTLLLLMRSLHRLNGFVAKSVSECRSAEPTAIVAFHIADLGDYLRDEGGATV